MDNYYKAVIKFAEKQWLIIDNFEYENEKYFYIVEDVSEELKETKDIEKKDLDIHYEFIYKEDDENYTNVTDKQLREKLLLEVGKRMVTNKEITDEIIDILKYTKEGN